MLRSQTAKKVDKNAVALKAFFAIADKWQLTSQQAAVLLGIPLSTFYRWKEQRTAPLSADTFERVSYILGIYKALRILLPNENAANAWIHKPNSAILFGGKTALEKLLVGRVIDLADVRRYLDAQRG